MRCYLAIAVLAVSTHAARAQPAMTAPIERGEAWSETTATSLAIGTTAMGVALIAGGAEQHFAPAGVAGLVLTVVGPSAGHLYAGETSHALGMSLLRAGSFATFTVGLVAGFETSKCGDCGNADDDHTGSRMLMVAGGGVFVAATAYDLFDAHHAARRANERAFVLAPTALAAPSGTVPGLALAGRF